MKPPTDLDILTTYARNERTDWLPENPQPEQYAEMLVSLANRAGGMVLVGISDKGVVGVQDSEMVIDHLIQAALSINPPLIMPIPRTLKHQNTQIVIAQVPAGMPHVYATQTGKYLHRQNSDIVALSPRELRRLMLERGEMTFETDITQGASYDDLDWTKVTEYVRGMGGFGEKDVEQVLIRRGCLVQRGNVLRPTNAGILLFGKDPQRFIRGADITAVRFAGEMMGDTFNRQDIGGTLIDQIKRAETFLFDHLRRDVTLTQNMARRDQYEYPMEAARELVINAVAHRDYSIVGDNIRLLIYSNRMEVYSAGNLPGYMTLENLKDERFSRNPIIVQILADLHFIERLGYGINRVLELMQAQRLHAPQFEERAGGFTVTLYNATTKTTHPHTEIVADDMAIVGVYNGMPINARQEAALNFLIKNDTSRITNSDLKSLFPHIHPETIRRDLMALVTKGVLLKLGQKRGSYYVLKRDGMDAEISEDEE